MIKKISTKDLTEGMAVVRMGETWPDHPFKADYGFLRKASLKKLKQSGVAEFYIDTEKGIDVPSADPSSTTKDQPKVKQSSDTKTDEYAPATEELKFATKVVDEARTVTGNLLTDARLGKQVEAEKIDNVVEKMIESVFRNQNALLSLGRIRQVDVYTFEHSVSVGVLLAVFAKALGHDKETIHKIMVGGMLHDVGKMKVPQDILNKPGRLTKEEFEIIKQHVKYSTDLLTASPGIDPISILVASEHHERYDGTGYLEGLDGGEISPYGQMAAIVDVYDAITTDRCYHKATPPSLAIKKLQEWGQTQYNLNLLDTFIYTLGLYPPGSLVRLESGLIGIVIDGVEEPLIPVVRVIYDSNTKSLVPVRDIDLANPDENPNKDRVVSHESPENWNINPTMFF